MPSDVGPVAVVPLWLLQRMTQGRVGSDAIALYVWVATSKDLTVNAMASALGISAARVRTARDELEGAGALDGNRANTMRVLLTPASAPPEPSDPPPAAPEPIAGPKPVTSAHRLAQRAWELIPRPINPGGFLGLRSVLKSVLETGVDERQLEGLIDSGQIKVWTVNGIATSLARNPHAGENPDGWWLQ